MSTIQNPTCPPFVPVSLSLSLCLYAYVYHSMPVQVTVCLPVTPSDILTAFNIVSPGVSLSLCICLSPYISFSLHYQSICLSISLCLTLCLSGCIFNLSDV